MCIITILFSNVIINTLDADPDVKLDGFPKIQTSIVYEKMLNDSNGSEHSELRQGSVSSELKDSIPSSPSLSSAGSSVIIEDDLEPVLDLDRGFFVIGSRSDVSHVFNFHVMIICAKDLKDVSESNYTQKLLLNCMLK